MPKILVTNNYDESVRRILEDLCPPRFELIFLARPIKENLLEACVEADYFLVGGRLPIDKEVIQKAANLKMIQRTGVGLDQIDLDAVKAEKIPLYVNRGVNARAVAEHTLMLMLALLRKLQISDPFLKGGNWEKQKLGIQTQELHGKMVGLIGLGNIGEIVANLLKRFGVEVLYTKRNRLDPETEDRLNIKYVGLEELLGTSDIVSLHCPVNETTKDIINGESIRLMKDGAVLINTSRGKLVDEKALIEALEIGKIGAAGLDVFNEEPLRPENELLRLKNVILTPHISGITKESFSRMIKKGFGNIESFERKQLQEIENYRIC